MAFHIQNYSFIKQLVVESVGTTLDKSTFF
jgi:hypothetical protein